MQPIEYTRLEERLRNEAHFSHDTTQGAPRCRWLVDGVIVDIMPSRAEAGHVSDHWYEYALQTAALRTLNGVTVRTVARRHNRCAFGEDWYSRSHHRG